MKIEDTEPIHANGISGNATDPRGASPHEEVPACRVCHCEGDDLAPLFYPCKCDGSIKYVHQECLLQWLKIKNQRLGSARCELCGELFGFKVEGQTQRLSLIEFFRGLYEYIKSHMLLAAKIFFWVGLVPWNAGLQLYRINTYLNARLVDEGYYHYDVLTPRNEVTYWANMTENIIIPNISAWWNGALFVAVVVVIYLVVMEVIDAALHEYRQLHALVLIERLQAREVRMRDHETRPEHVQEREDTSSDAEFVDDAVPETNANCFEPIVSDSAAQSADQTVPSGGSVHEVNNLSQSKDCGSQVTTVDVNHTVWRDCESDADSTSDYLSDGLLEASFYLCASGTLLSAPDVVETAEHQDPAINDDCCFRLKSIVRQLPEEHVNGHSHDGIFEHDEQAHRIEGYPRNYHFDRPLYEYGSTVGLEEVGEVSEAFQGITDDDSDESQDVMNAAEVRLENLGPQRNEIGLFRENPPAMNNDVVNDLGAQVGNVGPDIAVEENGVDNDNADILVVVVSWKFIGLGNGAVYLLELTRYIGYIIVKNISSSVLSNFKQDLYVLLENYGDHFTELNNYMTWVPSQFVLDADSMVGSCIVCFELLAGSVVMCLLCVAFVLLAAMYMVFKDVDLHVSMVRLMVSKIRVQFGEFRKVARAGLIGIVEAVVYPHLFGWVVGLSTLKLFGTTAASRMSQCMSMTILCGIVHGIVGGFFITHSMFVLYIIISSIKVEYVHPAIRSYFTVYEEGLDAVTRFYLEKSIGFHVQRHIILLALLLLTAVCIIAIPLHVGNILFPFMAPLTLRFNHSGSEFQVSMEVLFVHVMLPLIADSMQSFGFKHIIRQIVRCWAQIFKLEYLLHEEEVPVAELLRLARELLQARNGVIIDPPAVETGDTAEVLAPADVLQDQNGTNAGLNGHPISGTEDSFSERSDEDRDSFGRCTVHYGGTGNPSVAAVQVGELDDQAPTKGLFADDSQVGTDGLLPDRLQSAASDALSSPILPCTALKESPNVHSTADASAPMTAPTGNRFTTEKATSKMFTLVRLSAFVVMSVATLVLAYSCLYFLPLHVGRSAMAFCRYRQLSH
jgi:hypothetical protein